MSEHEPLPEGEEPVPEGARVMTFVRWGLFVVMAAVAALSFWFLIEPAGKTRLKYTCPMVEHAFVVTDEAGECPLCHMTLMPLDTESIDARKAELQAAGPQKVKGVVPVALHLDRVQRGGVSTTKVVARELASGKKAPAYVAAPEQGQAKVHARAAGFVERVLVGEVGAQVGAGQVMALYYAPDVYRAQEELLAVHRWGDGASGGAHAGMGEAIKRRLELFGMSSADIDALVKQGSPSRLVAIRAPASGTITRKELSLGAYVTPEMTLYEIVDLGRAYVVAEVFGRDAAGIKVGATAEVSLPSLGSEVHRAKVDLVYPDLNVASRTLRVRLRLEDRPKGLRPGVFGEARFGAERRRALLVPRDAVIDTGDEQYAFVDGGDGHFEPRKVRVGAEEGELLEITEGLLEGEPVVSRAAFLIDAESRLLASFVQPKAPASASAAPASSGGAP